MNGYRTRGKTIFLSYLVAILLLSWLCLVSPGLALMALPDVGIDYKTMKVIQVEKLIAAGMKSVRNGDTISMSTSPKEGKIIFRNLRTGEELSYPPPGQKEKEK